MQVAQQRFKTSKHHVRAPFVLEDGNILQDLTIQYTTYGILNEERSNVVWVFHALTANSEADEWWPGLVGEGAFFDPAKYFIVCANMLGSCYGSTEPKSKDFPRFTIGDIVTAHKILFKHLGLSEINVGIGGSMGGQQLLEWAVQEPSLFKTIIPIATNSVHSAWAIAFNETQRMALEHPDSAKGIETARAIAMLSYRCYDQYDESQFDDDQRLDDFSASSYQRYQGQKLEKRFSPLSYYYLSKAMDSHNIGRKFGGVPRALNRIQSKGIVIGIDTDILFPLEEQKKIARHIPNASFHQVTSKYGHDGFLTETVKIAQIIREQLDP